MGTVFDNALELVDRTNVVLRELIAGLSAISSADDQPQRGDSMHESDEQFGRYYSGGLSSTLTTDAYTSPPTNFSSE